MNNASKGRCVTITPSDKPKKTLNFTRHSRKGKIINNNFCKERRFARNISCPQDVVIRNEQRFS